MAEGWVNHLLGATYQAYSAGTTPSDTVHPLAVQVMSEVGIDIAAGIPKHPHVFRHLTFDLVITVCDDAAEKCPLWLREGRVVHIGFDDPARAQGPETARLAVFRHVRDEIRTQIFDFLHSLT
jgi:arsenate reductase